MCVFLGASVLAKPPSDKLWQQGVVELVSKTEAVVKWSNGSSQDTVSFEDILPFSGQDSSETREIAFNDIEEDIIINIDPTSEKLGNWEQYT